MMYGLQPSNCHEEVMLDKCFKKEEKELSFLKDVCFNKESVICDRKPQQNEWLHQPCFNKKRIDNRHCYFDKSDRAQGIYQDSIKQRCVSNEVSKNMDQKAAIMFDRTTTELKNILENTKDVNEQLVFGIKKLLALNAELNKRIERVKRARLAMLRLILMVDDNLAARQRRQGEDNIPDEVELALIKEKDYLHEARKMYDDFIDLLTCQRQKNQRLKERLDSIWSNKKYTEKILEMSSQLNLDSNNIQPFPAIETIMHPKGIMYDRREIVKEFACYISGVKRNEDATNEAMKFVEEKLAAIVKQIEINKEKVEEAFKGQIFYYKRAIEKLKERLKEVTEELNKLEKEKTRIKEKINKLKKYIVVAESRGKAGLSLFVSEIATDESNKSNYYELEELRKMVHKLECQLAEIETTQGQVRQVQNQLEILIQMKYTNLQIDEDHCMKHREVFSSEKELMGCVVHPLYPLNI